MAPTLRRGVVRFAIRGADATGCGVWGMDRWHGGIRSRTDRTIDAALVLECHQPSAGSERGQGGRRTADQRTVTAPTPPWTSISTRFGLVS